MSGGPLWRRWLRGWHHRVGTQRGYYLPPSRLAYKLAAGFVTNRGMREARRRDLVGSE